MGVITEISLQKNKNRVNLFIDNSFFCGLMKETLVKNNLKVGVNVNEDRLKQIIEESETRKALDYSFALVAKKEYTKFEIIKKLKTKGYDENVIYNVIEKLVEYKAIDDEGFASACVSGYRFLSKRQLEQKMMQKGVDRQIIKNAVNGIKNEDEEAKIEVISAKYIKNKPKNLETLQKLNRYLAGKGFDFDLIKNCISKLEIGEDYESWD